MTKEIEHRFEFTGATEDMGIRFLDTKMKLPYMLDEKTGELIGTGRENWHKRMRITKETDIDTDIPFFRKTNEKMKGLDVYANIKGERYAHDKEKNLFIGVDQRIRGQILHVRKQEKLPVFGMIPIIHYPLYVAKRKFSEYPFLFAGTAFGGLSILEPLIMELQTVNSPLAIAVASTPALAGYVAEKIARNPKLHDEFRKDIHKFEDFAHKEYHKFRTWEEKHFEKKLEKVI